MNTREHTEKNTDIEQQIEKSFRDQKLKKNLINYAYKLTKNDDQAQDIVQQARCNVWRKNKTLEWKNPQALLMKIIKNEFINQYRKKKNKPTANFSKERQRDNIHIAVENNAEGNFAVRAIQTKIDDLSENLKTPLILRIQNYSYKEIAKTLNLPMGTIKSRIFLAREEMATALLQEDKSYQPFITKKSSPKPSQPGQDFPQQSL